MLYDLQYIKQQRYQCVKRIHNPKSKYKTRVGQQGPPTNAKV
jgi:hypothetical protein